MLLAIALLFSGCAPWWLSSATSITQIKYDPKPTEQVEILYQEPHISFEVIGFVSAELIGSVRTENKTTAERGIQKCRELAASMSADSVIITFASNRTFERMGRANGRAIRWVKEEMK
jgi:hypothetical protein